MEYQLFIPLYQLKLKITKQLLQRKMLKTKKHLRVLMLKA